MLTIKVINTPSKGIIQVLCRRVADEIVKEKLKKGVYTSLGLIQGPLAAMITAGDLAEKTSNVEIAEIAEIIGNCPQHITVLGVFGDTSSVSEALKAVEIWEKQDML